MPRRTGHLGGPAPWIALSLTIAPALVAAGAAGAACSRSEVKDHGLTSQGSQGSGAAPAPALPPPPTFTLFGLAELRGQIGPCGCTTDPLGDLSRTAKVIADARAAGPTIVVDAGSLLYSMPRISPQHAAQEELKADLLARTYTEQLAVDAIGLGWADLVQGPAKVRLARQAVNVPAAAGVPLAAPRILEVGGAKLGVFGVVDPAAVGALAPAPGDPVAAGRAAVADLRRRGARVVVALVQAPQKRDAVKLVRAIGGIDLAVAGLGHAAPEPAEVEAEATPVGDGWLVVPANRGQVVPRLAVTVRDDAGPLTDAGGPAAAAARIAGLERQLAALDADLARFAKDPSADAAFVARKQGERRELAARRDRLRAAPYELPARGSYFTLEQVRINKTRACAPAVQDAVTAFFRAAGAANERAAAGVRPAPPPRGTAGYVGNAACEDCHGDETEFWQQTRHAGAWDTLVERGQQLDLDCIGCHVTGWGQPGGSNLAFNEPLRDVGCETCHGPGSIHVAKGGEEKPAAILRAPAPELCATQCHTKEHSDTFQYEAYLRDIVGPGHGKGRRARLGDGPTGATLRKAGLAKAGAKGPGCVR